MARPSRARPALALAQQSALSRELLRIIAAERAEKEAANAIDPRSEEFPGQDDCFATD